MNIITKGYGSPDLAIITQGYGGWGSVVQEFIRSFFRVYYYGEERVLKYAKEIRDIYKPFETRLIKKIERRKISKDDG